MKTTYFNLDEGAMIHLMPGDEVYLVTEVSVRPGYRRRGAASRLMDEMIADADREGVPLILTVQPDVPGVGLDFDQLVAFYSRKGFTELDSEGTMVREPKS